MRDILDQVEAQRLGHILRRPTSEGEERAVYGVMRDGPDIHHPISPALPTTADA